MSSSELYHSSYLRVPLRVSDSKYSRGIAVVTRPLSHAWSREVTRHTVDWLVRTNRCLGMHPYGMDESRLSDAPSIVLRVAATLTHEAASLGIQSLNQT